MVAGCLLLVANRFDNGQSTIDNLQQQSWKRKNLQLNKKLN